MSAQVHEGTLIVLEGIDGCGKSTLAKELVAPLTRALRRQVVVASWRENVPDPEVTKYDDMLFTRFSSGPLLADANTLLAMATVTIQRQIQVYLRVMVPVLMRGGVAIADGFITRIITRYRCYMSLLSSEPLDNGLVPLPISVVHPNVTTFYLGIPVDLAWQLRGDAASRFETAQFLRPFQNAQEGFLSFQRLYHAALMHEAERLHWWQLHFPDTRDIAPLQALRKREILRVLREDVFDREWTGQ